MTANREYKDSLFSWLFSDPPALRELYGALTGVPLSPDIPITINTLEDVLFKGRLNDISFEIAGRLIVLIEHQSTINENMPLRLLLYIAKLYEKFTGGKDVYRERRITLLRPEFIVLYNGVAPCPDETTLRLSDAFRETGGLGLAPADGNFLELIVTVYNINRGHNEPILRRCKNLEGYSAFIAAVRKYEQKTKTRDEAIRLAVKDCIANDILKDILETHAAEVMNMLMTEWNWDDAKEVWFEEGMEKGMEKGMEEGRNMVLELMKQGYSVDQIEAKLAADKTGTAGK
ncbi:MAG: Rpn family recombination-promoting nuclease/putative transposase [Treponema sp.]|jgi:hypothetical protein|nr:Rpn family recombination-promoting nuclease/putative transposase [Treponema sp.]